ncbi:MAG: acyl-CoA thioesterase [Clostridia bacterium]|nr:acyl-CoA thioesterase [Clostridia bacterium]MBQ2669630.1 acyl-CoA thioesterase [Clostridia bacterium]MBQ3462892.1 acyl-CoA thioesterase [Clostridia bacterium]MBQ3471245.1 acyl-CoA thioesterase [Clostridia bacterium]MBQ9598229.1 acyl-CoA thioesterase [Clostridia bacterium]
MSYISETYLTVRYAETDMMGIVHHSRYYPWFEVARTEFIKKTGLTYTEMEQMGILLPLTETGAKYHLGLKYEDEVVIKCRITKLTVARCEFGYEVYRLPDMTLATEGRTAHGFVGKDFVPLNLKKTFPDVWEKLCGLVED